MRIWAPLLLTFACTPANPAWAEREADAGAQAPDAGSAKVLRSCLAPTRAFLAFARPDWEETLVEATALWASADVPEIEVRDDCPHKIDAFYDPKHVGEMNAGDIFIRDDVLADPCRDGELRQSLVHVLGHELGHWWGHMAPIHSESGLMSEKQSWDCAVVPPTDAEIRQLH